MTSSTKDLKNTRSHRCFFVKNYAVYRQIRDLHSHGFFMIGISKVLLYWISGSLNTRWITAHPKNQWTTRAPRITPRTGWNHQANPVFFSRINPFSGILTDQTTLKSPGYHHTNSVFGESLFEICSSHHRYSAESHPLKISTNWGLF